MVHCWFCLMHLCIWLALAVACSFWLRMNHQWYWSVGMRLHGGPMSAPSKIQRWCWWGRSWWAQSAIFVKEKSSLASVLSLSWSVAAQKGVWTFGSSAGQCSLCQRWCWWSHSWWGPSAIFVKESSSPAFVLSLSWSVGSTLSHKHGPAPHMSEDTPACCYIVAMLVVPLWCELICSSSCMRSFSIPDRRNVIVLSPN